MVKTVLAIPAFNEELAIGSIVLKAREYVDEVLVIDDGSEDSTRSVAQMAMATVLSHRKNLGKGAAIRTAFDYVRRNGHEVVVLMDGDGQHHAEDLPKVMQPILDGEADVVVGKRWGKTDGMPIYRRVGKRVLDYTTGAVTGVVTDSQSGFRAFSRKAVDVLDVNAAGFGAESEILIQANGAGLRVAEVAIGTRYDLDGSTLSPVEHGFRVLDSILYIVAERHPLFFIAFPSVLLFLFGIYLGMLTLQIYSQTGAFATGYALIVAILVILGSLGIFTGVMLNILPRSIERRVHSWLK